MHNLPLVILILFHFPYSGPKAPTPVIPTLADGIPFIHCILFIIFISFIHFIHFILLTPFILIRFRYIGELQQNLISFPLFLFLNVPGGLVERLERIERMTSGGFLVENTIMIRSLEFIPLNADSFNELTNSFNSFHELLTNERIGIFTFTGIGTDLYSAPFPGIPNAFLFALHIRVEWSHNNLDFRQEIAMK